MKKNSKNILIGVTASIAAYKSCEIIRVLKQKGFNVKAMMSPDAKHFITPLTLQTLSCDEAVSDMFKTPEKWDIYHTSLADWADVILIAPATADIIAKLAHGFADCIVSATVLASKAKILIAPAMNEKMYKHKALQDNLKRLNIFGYEVISPKKGYLACGYEGMGHLADVEVIVKVVQNA